MDDLSKEIVVIFGQYDLSRLKALYKKTGNGAIAWNAYKVARLTGLDIPEWVINYLDDCSKRLDRANNPQAISKALQMYKGGGLSAEKRMQVTKHQYKMIQSVAILKGLDPQRRYKDIFEQVARENGTTEKHAKNLWYWWLRDNKS